MAVKLEILSKYNFNTYAPHVFGNNHRSMLLINIATYRDAVRERDVEVQHNSVYPLLPEGTLKDYRQLTYLQFEDLNGQTVWLAKQWINDSSLELIENQTLNISVSYASASDVNLIREVLAQNGFKDIVITPAA